MNCFFFFPDILPGENQILHTNHTYLAVQKICEAVVSRADADTLSLDIPLPINNEQEVVDLYVNVCQRNKSIKVIPPAKYVFLW